MHALLLIAAASIIAQDSARIRILSINDYHGAPSTREYTWSEGRTVGGSGVVSATMDSLETECGCTVFRVGAGDMMQGTLASNVVYGQSIVESLDSMRLDATAIGNHEFDWSRDTLQARMRESRFPWLAANIFDAETGERVPWAQPWTVVERDGVRVGFVGYLTSGTPTVVRPSMVVGLEFPKGADAIRDVLETVRARGVDFVVILAHASTGCSETRCGESILLAHELGPDGVDLIVGGHDHQVQDTVVNGVPVIEAWATGRAVGVADLYRSADGDTSFEMRVDTTYADQVTPDGRAAGVMARFEHRVNDLANRVIATTLVAQDRDGQQYPLGNMIADALRRAARADVALNNNGGIRAPINAGPITFGELFQVHPFGNLVTRVTVTGEQLLAQVEHSLQRGVPRAHLSGVYVTFDASRPVGSRVVDIRLPDGTSVDPHATYVLAVPDFLAEGGDGYPLAGLPRETLSESVLDAIVTYLGANGGDSAFDETVRVVEVNPAG